MNNSSDADTNANTEYIISEVDKSDEDFSFLQSLHASDLARDLGTHSSRSSSKISHTPDAMAAEQTGKAAPAWRQGQYASSFTRSAVLHAQICGFQQGTQVPEWATMVANPPRGTPYRSAFSPKAVDPSSYAVGIVPVAPEAKAFRAAISPFVPRRSRKPRDVFNSQALG